MKIGVIIGSTRSGRLGERVGKWVMGRLQAMPEAEATLLDLKDFPLPFYEEELLPGQIKDGYASEVANRWAKAVGEMDGFVIVTPEYNHGYPGVLKNALDYLSTQWNDKPVSFVSYSSGAIGAARSVEQLRQVVGNLKLVALSEALHLGKAQELLDEQGTMLAGPFDQLLDKQLSQTLRWAKTMAAHRAA